MSAAQVIGYQMQQLDAYARAASHMVDGAVGATGDDARELIRGSRMMALAAEYATDMLLSGASNKWTGSRRFYRYTARQPLQDVAAAAAALRRITDDASFTGTLSGQAAHDAQRAAHELTTAVRALPGFAEKTASMKEMTIDGALGFAEQIAGPRATSLIEAAWRAAE